MTIDPELLYFVRVIGEDGIYPARAIPYNDGAFYKWDVLGKSYRWSDSWYPQERVQVVAVGRVEQFLAAVGAKLPTENAV